MNIEPQTVEPGFAKRWTVQAIALMFRSPITWTMIILCYFFGSQIISHSIWLLFLGGFLLMLSLEFACYTDFNKMSLNSFISCIHISFKNYIQYIKDKKIFIITFCILFFLIDLMANYAISKSTKEISTPNLSEISIFSNMMFTVIFGYIFLNSGSMLQIFSYPLRRAFDSNEVKAIDATCEKAKNKNPEVFLFFELFVFMGMILLATFFPITGIFFSGFLPCLIYVAFREIFWGKKENQKQEENLLSGNKSVVLINIKD